MDEVIGLIHTDEPTDSVEEVRKLRGRTNERFIVDTAGTLIDMVTRNTYDYVSEVCPLLNEMAKENEQLKSFKQKVFDLIDKTIEEETQIAENIEEVAQETRPYAKAVNRITIITLEHLKLELQE